MNAVDELNALLGIGPPKPRLPITLQRSGYESIKQLGKGSFGEAYLIFHKSTQRYFVAKHVNMAKMDQRARKEARNEISILQQLKHPNVVRYEESVEQGTELYIVMEYADGGDLYSHINKVKASGAMMTEDQVLNLFVQVAMAIKYMHDRKVIHRDIKPQNVFLTKSRVVKLGDFGISTVLNHTMAMAKTMCGTPCYFSPELCDSRPYNNKSDVWALGVMLYEMASFELPFDSPNMKRLMDDIRTKQPVRKRAFSDGLWSLIEMMLTKDPLKRPDMDGVLAHPTVTKAMPRIAKLLAESAAPTAAAAKEDDPMLQLWKQKREREQREAAAKLAGGGGIADVYAAAGAGANAVKINGSPTPSSGAQNASPKLQPTPPSAPPVVAPAARAESNPSNASPVNKTPYAQQQPQSAAALERAKRDEEYRKLREEMAKIEESRRQRMEKERKQEAGVEEQLKKREELLAKQKAAEAAEEELRRAEALKKLKEKEEREQQLAAEVRAQAKARRDREEQEALLSQQRAAEASALAAKEAREKADAARKLAEQQHQAVMMAESPPMRPAAQPYDDDIVDETEEDLGINAVIRNMNTFHERSVNKKGRGVGGGGVVPDDAIDDEVGPVTAMAPTPNANDKKKNKKDLHNDSVIFDEVPNHTFEDPMGTRINVEEIALASPPKGAARPLNRLAAPPNVLEAGGGRPSVNRSLNMGGDDGAASDDNDDPIQGGCLCGRVEYTGYISYIYGSFTCTCNLCKRFTGSTLGVSWLHLPAVVFPEVVKPSDALRNFALNDGKTHCYFCRKCGASIAMEHPGVDGCVISKASLDEKSAETLNRNQRTARN